MATIASYVLALEKNAKGNGVSLDQESDEQLKSYFLDHSNQEMINSRYVNIG